VSNNLVFDYATLYRRLHPEMAEARNFRVTDDLYKDFSTFLSTKEYSYKTESETLLEEFETIAIKEKYFEAAEVEYNLLKAKIDHDKKADVEKAREQLSELLADEIVSRYFFQKGRIEASFAFDPEIKRAVEILNDTKFYNEIISGKYVEDIKKKGK
jgi:carboxyl-terminal processing protease